MRTFGPRRAANTCRIDVLGRIAKPKSTDPSTLMNRIYLATPSPDDAENIALRDRLLAHLSQFEGMEIFPKRPATELTDEDIDSAIEAADLSVHFFHVSPGRTEADGRGVVQRQFEIAEEVEHRREEDLAPREPRIVFLKSRRLMEIEDSRFDPEEWDFDDGEGGATAPDKALRSHLGFLCRVLKQRAPVRLFYSYARSDREHLERMRRSLVMSRRSGRVIEWYDGFLNPGEDWNEATGAALDECDVLVYLVTPESVASSYAYHREYGRALKAGKKVVAVSVSSAVLSDTGIADNQMMPIDERSRLKPVDEWESTNRAWTCVAEQLNEVLEAWSKGRRQSRGSVPMEPCANLGDLKELLEARFRLRRQRGRSLNGLGPMIFLDWVRRPSRDSRFERLKDHLARRSRLTCASEELSGPRDRDYTETMYGCSDAVLVYCADRERETATTLQKWVWQVERKRRSIEDRPRCIGVLDFAEGSGELSSAEFAESLPCGGTVFVIGDFDADSEPESLLEPLWSRIEP